MNLSSRPLPPLSIVAFGVALVAALAACGSPQDPSSPNQLDPAAFPLTDAPYQLASDRDLEDARDRYLSMDDADPERQPLRQELAREYARRMSLTMERPTTQEDAYARLLDLMSLYTAAELDAMTPEQRASELAPYLPTVLAMRERFARSGMDIETTATLYFAALADPTNAQRYLGEVDEIFTYADALARAEYGDGAEASRPIAILESLVARVPVNRAVDRLVELYIVRQEIITRLFPQPDLRMQLIRAHGSGVLTTTALIIRVLARAGRLQDAPPYLSRFTGIGYDAKLAAALNQALAPDATDASWKELSRYYTEPAQSEEDDDKVRRLRGAMAVCQAGLKRFPKSAPMARCAGKVARELDLMHVAIRYYEIAVANAPKDRNAANDLADLYRVRVSTLAFYERPLAALERLRELEAFHERMAKKWSNRPLDTDLADAYASVARGMTSLGELARAQGFLERSLKLRPSSGALEQLGTLAYKRGQLKQAVGYYDRALKMPADEILAQYERARILRLSGDALAQAGKTDRAADRWRESLLAWTQIDDQYDLPPQYKGEVRVELGKDLWALGLPQEALNAFEAAVDSDPDGADTHSSVVSFLIVRGQYRRALDAYHRALGSYEISPYSKVYMSLWVLAEARRTGTAPDPLARDYLASREGPLWHDRLARFASGREPFGSLEEHASTRGQRAELLYYSAVLDDDLGGDAVRAAMRKVIATDMVQFYEYEMAQHWLAEGFAPRDQAPAPAAAPAPAPGTR